MSTLVFEPLCLNCGAHMGIIYGLGLALEGGAVSCPVCGEDHNYMILEGSGRMTLKRVSVPIGLKEPIEGIFEGTIKPIINKEPVEKKIPLRQVLIDGVVWEYPQRIDVCFTKSKPHRCIKKVQEQA